MPIPPRKQSRKNTATAANARLEKAFQDKPRPKPKASTDTSSKSTVSPKDAARYKKAASKLGDQLMRSNTTPKKKSK